VAVHYESAHTPLITTRGDRLYWQPTDWSEPFNQFVPKYQVGSTYPVYRVATLLHELAARQGRSHVVDVERPLPISVHAWRSDGVDHVLIGNLETGEFGDSRLARHVVVRLGIAELALGDRAGRLRRIDGNGPAEVDLRVTDDGAFAEFTIDMPPESGAVYQVRGNDDPDDR